MQLFKSVDIMDQESALRIIEGVKTMASILCERVAAGLRPSAVIAVFQDYRGKRHFFCCERDFLDNIGDNYYLPVGVVHIDPKTKAVLVELEHEAETGANRVWIRPENLDEPIEAYS
jgi:hypothetical protein